MNSRTFYWVMINVVSTILATLIIHYTLRFLEKDKA